MTAYVLQSNQNPSLCIAVNQPTAGSFVTLQILAGVGNKNSQWNLDANSGHITLAADPSLCLDVQGVIGQQGQVIIADVVLGRASQRWNWVGNPPFIANVGYPNMVLDNAGATVAPGNPILVWPLNNGQNQKWSRYSVPMLENARGSSAGSSGSPKLEPVS